ncbi:hypothetical protein M0811_03661 [Anaeramoeba ignava]|uniref:PAS domain-containing protein n=1 Tax=Anaeramoeba ignava TaxID=1746090 RepID=A0A9Q0LW69_ANAIG|nr:hypothetical protein M0811_03661 [Anaeramoeba ignava]
MGITSSSCLKFPNVKLSKYKNILEQTVDPFASVDNEGNFIDSNEALLSFLKVRSAKQLLKFNVWSFTPRKQKNFEQSRTSIQQSFCEKLFESLTNTIDFDFQIKNIFGEMQWVHVWARPITVNSKILILLTLKEIEEPKSEISHLSTILDTMSETESTFGFFDLQMNSEKEFNRSNSNDSFDALEIRNEDPSQILSEKYANDLIEDIDFEIQECLIEKEILILVKNKMQMAEQLKREIQDKDKTIQRLKKEIQSKKLLIQNWNLKIEKIQAEYFQNKKEKQKIKSETESRTFISSYDEDEVILSWEENK